MALAPPVTDGGKPSSFGGMAAKAGLVDIEYGNATIFL